MTHAVKIWNRVFFLFVCSLFSGSFFSFHGATGSSSAFDPWPMRERSVKRSSSHLNSILRCYSFVCFLYCKTRMWSSLNRNENDTANGASQLLASRAGRWDLDEKEIFLATRAEFLSRFRSFIRRDGLELDRLESFSRARLRIFIISHLNSHNWCCHITLRDCLHLFPLFLYYTILLHTYINCYVLTIIIIVGGWHL